MNKFTEYIKENHDQMLLKIKEICEDSIQEIIDDLRIDNFDDIRDTVDSWTNYWQSKNGWYKIQCYINDKQYFQPVVEVKVEFFISKNKGNVGVFKVNQELKGLLHRLDLIGFISNVSNEHGRGSTNEIKVKSISKINHIILI